MNIILDQPEHIMSFHMLAQYHACKLELQGMGHSSGRSIIKHVRVTYQLGDSLTKKEVVLALQDMLQKRGVKLSRVLV